MKILFPLSLFFIVTCTQAIIDTEADSTFDTVGNKSLYDHIPPSARKKAKKISLHVISPMQDKTAVIGRDSDGNITRISDKKSGWLNLSYEGKIIFFSLSTVALVGFIIKIYYIHYY